MLGVMIGVLVSKKVDRPNLILGFFLTLLLSTFLGFQLPILWLLIFVSFFTLIDEFFHDRVNKIEGNLHQVFNIRPLLKISIVLLAIISLIDLIQALGFLFFDFAYDATNFMLDRYSK